MTTTQTEPACVPATEPRESRPIGFQAIWRAKYHDPSEADVIEPDPAYPLTPRYIAAYVGGYSGVRLDIADPADAEQLAAVLLAASAECRARAAADEAKENTDDDH
jgi:hypothetical protein